MKAGLIYLNILSCFQVFSKNPYFLPKKLVVAFLLNSHEIKISICQISQLFDDFWVKTHFFNGNNETKDLLGQKLEFVLIKPAKIKPLLSS